MTTATDWDVRDRETNDQLDVTAVQAEIDRLDGAATEAPVQIELWVAKTPAAITPAPMCGMCGGPETGRTERTDESDIPARTWARMSGARSWPQIPDTALTEYGRAQAEYDSAHQQIQDLRDLAFWAEQQQRKIVSRVSDEYRAKRASVESRYDREIGHLHNGLDHATYAAYVKALPDYVRGNSATVATGRHTSVYSELAPDRIAIEDGPPHRLPPPPPPPADRSGLDKLKRRVPTALTTGEQPGPESQPETPEQTPAPRRSWWRSEWVAGAVIVVGWVAIIATMVVLA